MCRWKPACTVTRAARRRSRSPGPGTAPGRRQQEPEGGDDAGGRRADDALDTEPRGEIPGMDRARPTRREQHVATGVASMLGDVDPRGARGDDFRASQTSPDRSVLQHRELSGRRPAITRRCTSPQLGLMMRRPPLLCRLRCPRWIGRTLCRLNPTHPPLPAPEPARMRASLSAPGSRARRAGKGWTRAVSRRR